MPTKRSALILSLFVLGALAIVATGCDSATPVAPSGTVLTLSASPSTIGLRGSSVITVTGRRPDGNPLNEGTEIRFSTSLGTIQSIVSVNENGVAQSTLVGDGRAGTAEVTATTGSGGDGAVTAMVNVQVGESDETRPTVTVSVNPSTAPVDSTATVTVIARNADGTPVAAGMEVILTTTLGSLNPARPRTGSDGTATSTLNTGSQAGTAEIQAIVGSSAVAETTVTIREAATDINVQANPSTVPAAGGTTTLTAFVTNSQGEPLQGAAVTFDSQRGVLETNGVVFTDTRGVATNTLTVAEDDLTNVQSFQVTASTPSGTGDLLSAATTIRVQGQ